MKPIYCDHCGANCGEADHASVRLVSVQCESCLLSEMKTITITVPLPGRTLSPNARAHWQTKRASVRRARNTAAIMARQALDGRPAPKWERARAEVAFHFADKRRRDPDNMMAALKATWDGIADAGIVANDSGIWPERPTFEIDKASPRVVITLTEEKE